MDGGGRVREHGGGDADCDGSGYYGSDLQRRTAAGYRRGMRRSAAGPDLDGFRQLRRRCDSGLHRTEASETGLHASVRGSYPPADLDGERSLHEYRNLDAKDNRGGYHRAGAGRRASGCDSGMRATAASGSYSHGQLHRRSASGVPRNHQRRLSGHPEPRVDGGGQLRQHRGGHSNRDRGGYHRASAAGAAGRRRPRLQPDSSNVQ